MKLTRDHSSHQPQQRPPQQQQQQQQSQSAFSAIAASTAGAAVELLLPYDFWGSLRFHIMVLRGRT